MKNRFIYEFTSYGRYRMMKIIVLFKIQNAKLIIKKVLNI